MIKSDEIIRVVSNPIWQVYLEKGESGHRDRYVQMEDSMKTKTLEARKRHATDSTSERTNPAENLIQTSNLEN